MTDRPIRKPLPEKWFVDYGTNAEMRWETADSDDPLTPTERFFVRNHVATPTVDVSSYRLRVYGDGLVGGPTRDGPITLALDDLRALPKRSATCVLECTGNGRAFFASQQRQAVRGTPWTLGGVGQATWTGVALADLLDHVGMLESAVDVMGIGLDEPYVVDGVDYGRVRRPLSVAKALEDVLLAFEMNGEPLLPDHGFPVRLIVPGWVGVASIKWLGELEVSSRRLLSPWNTRWYRMSGGDYGAGEPAFADLPVKSVFELPWPAELTAGRPTVLRGRSWSGGDVIESVEVSVDGGSSWRQARLVDEPVRDQWMRWELPWIPEAAGPVSLIARAHDASGEKQPDAVPFNPNGYLFWAGVRHPAVVAAD